jgi:hypothetical protein
MFVIRKKLYESEGNPPNTRYNPMCDCFEVTSDGGATWTEDPGADPRRNMALYLPPADDRCDAAVGMSAFVEDFLSNAYLAFSVVGISSAAIAIGAVWLPGIGQLVALAWALADFFLAVGEITLQVTFTPTVFEQLQCIFYCHLDADGRLDQERLDAVGVDIQDIIADGNVNIVMAAMFNLYGFVGFTNAGVTYAAIGDCTGCGCAWCHYWLLSNGAVDNLGISFLGGSITANGAESADFGGSALLTVDFEWDATVIRSLGFSYHCGAVGSGGTRDYVIYNGLTPVRSGAIDGGAGNFGEFEDNIDVITTRIRIQIHSNGHPEPNWVSDFTLTGVEEQPFGDDNC